MSADAPSPATEKRWKECAQCQQRHDADAEGLSDCCDALLIRVVDDTPPLGQAQRINAAVESRAPLSPEQLRYWCMRSVTRGKSACTDMHPKCGVCQTADYLESVTAQVESLQREREALIAENEKLKDWRADVTVALQREGGAFYEDVPGHIRELVRLNAVYQETADAYIAGSVELGAKCDQLTAELAQVKEMRQVSDALREKAELELLDRIAELDRLRREKAEAQ